MKRLSILMIVLALAACSVARPPAVVRVEVPIPVPCLTVIPEKPSFAVDELPLGAGIWKQMLALRADRIRRRAYEAELEAAINACK